MQIKTSLPPTLANQRNQGKALLIIIAILVIGAAAAGAAMWWVNRPIQATFLTLPEKEVLEQKIAAVEKAPEDPDYTPGDKSIILTERELNGLINENTAFGEQLKIELANNAVHARINADIPQDFPVMAGKKLKGRARFLIKDTEGLPSLILDDVTIWGISLPNAWLADLKGQNLLGNVLDSNRVSLAGIESISVENRTLVIQLAE